MKKIVLIIVFLLFNLSSYSQYIGYTPTYTPTSTEEWALIYSLARESVSRRSEAKNSALNIINKMKEYITYALAQNIDETLRKQLNSDYNLLKELTEYLRKEGYKVV